MYLTPTQGSDSSPPNIPGAPGHRAAVQPLTALVVDDDVSNAKLMAVILASEGFETRMAHSAEEALAIVDTFQPRVIILDLVLPLMSGILFAQTIKADPKTRDMVIVAVSAFNGREVERVALGVGCAAFVRKPIDALAFPRLIFGHLGADS